MGVSNATLPQYPFEQIVGEHLNGNYFPPPRPQSSVPSSNEMNLTVTVALFTISVIRGVVWDPTNVNIVLWRKRKIRRECRSRLANDAGVWSFIWLNYILYSTKNARNTDRNRNNAEKRSGDPLVWVQDFRANTSKWMNGHQVNLYKFEFVYCFFCGFFGASEALLQLFEIFEWNHSGVFLFSANFWQLSKFLFITTNVESVRRIGVYWPRQPDLRYIASWKCGCGPRNVDSKTRGCHFATHIRARGGRPLELCRGHQQHRRSAREDTQEPRPVRSGVAFAIFVLTSQSYSPRLIDHFHISSSVVHPFHQHLSLFRGLFLFSVVFFLFRVFPLNGDVNIWPLIRDLLHLGHIPCTNRV